MKKFILLFALFIFTYSNSFSQWSRANAGVDGGVIFSIYAVPSTNTVYCGSNGSGVFKSTNSGDNWSAVNNGITDYGFYPTCFTSVGSTVFMGANYSTGYPAGMYRTTNEGSSWQKINSGLNGPAKEISKSISKGNDVFISTDSGVYRSTNNGNNWLHITSSINPVPHAEGLFFKGDTLYIGTMQGVYYSSGTFTSWTLANAGLPADAALSFASYNGNLYASFFGEGVYVSANNGASWSVSNYNLTGSLLNLRCLYVFNNSLYVSCNGGVYMLGSNTWSSVSTGLPTEYPYFYWLTSASGKLITCTYGKGVYVSSNSGASWNQKISGLASSYLNTKKIISVNNVLYAASANNGVHRSTDNGVNWSSVNNGIPTSCNNVCAIDDKIFALTDGGVFSTSNGGANWAALNTGLTGNDLKTSALLKDGVNLFRGGYNGIFKSSNDGLSWVQTSFYGTQKQVTCMNKLNGTIFAGSSATSPTFFKSTNNFDSWTSILFFQSFQPELFTIFIEGDDIYLGTGHGVHRSSNMGANWTMLNNGLGGDPYVSSIIRVGSNLYCTQVFGGRGLFRSTNNGANWFDVSGDYIHFSDMNDVLNYDGKIFIATGSAIYYQPQDLVTSVTNPQGIVNSFKLYQNYPNPFNPATQINYSLAQSQLVRINVYDISGKLISELVNDFKQAGEYNVNFNASALSSGIYFYELQTEDFIETKKMLLVK